MLCLPVSYRGVVDILFCGWKRGEKTDVTSHPGESLGLVMSCYGTPRTERSKHRRGEVVRDGDFFRTSLHLAINKELEKRIRREKREVRRRRLWQHRGWGMPKVGGGGGKDDERTGVVGFTHCRTFLSLGLCSLNQMPVCVKAAALAAWNCLPRNHGAAHGPGSSLLVAWAFQGPGPLER